MLGEGGMAVVHRAWDRKERVWVAIKVLREERASDEKSLARFLEEARVLLEHSHRNLIGGYALGEGPPPFLVMELAEGGSLMDWVDRFGAMPPRMAVDCAIQLCKGAAAIHREGVVHRDIKPHNVLLNRKGGCKLTDFGIAKIVRADGTSDVPLVSLDPATALGTLGYMAPEQRLDGTAADPRMDVYGIAATLVTLVTGRTVMDLFVAAREPSLLHDVPDALRDVVLRASAFEPNDRTASVTDLAEELFGQRMLLAPTPSNTPLLAKEVPAAPTNRTPAPVQRDIKSSLPGHDRRARRPAITSLPPGKLQLPDELTPVPKRSRRRSRSRKLLDSLPPVTSTPPAVEPANPRPAQPSLEPVGPVVSDPPGSSSMGKVMAGLSVSILLLAILLVSGATWSVRSAESTVQSTSSQLWSTLDAEAAIIDDLRALGSDAAGLEKLYERQGAAPPSARPALADAYIERLEIDVAKYAGTSKKNAVAASAREHLTRITLRHEAMENAREHWEDSARAFPGNAAVSLGLASGP